LKDSQRSVENKIAGPKHHIYAGIWSKKWNFDLVSRILGAHCAEILRKSSIVHEKDA